MWSKLSNMIGCDQNCSWEYDLLLIMSSKYDWLIVLWPSLRNMIGWWSCDLNPLFWLAGYLSWSRNAAICAGVAATIRIIDNDLPVSGDIVMGEWVGREGMREEGWVSGWGGRRDGWAGGEGGGEGGGMGEWVGREGVRKVRWVSGWGGRDGWVGGREGTRVMWITASVLCTRYWQKTTLWFGEFCTLAYHHCNVYQASQATTLG